MSHQIPGFHSSTMPLNSDENCKHTYFFQYTCFRVRGVYFIFFVHNHYSLTEPFFLKGGRMLAGGSSESPAVNSNIGKLNRSDRHPLHLIQQPRSASYVYTSSRYDPEGNVCDPHKLPYLSKEQLQHHKAHARASSSLGTILPGFFPIHSSKDADHQLPLTSLILIPDSAPSSSGSRSSSSDDSTRDYFKSPDFSSDSSTAPTSGDDKATSGTWSTRDLELMQTSLNITSLLDSLSLRPQYDTRGQRSDPLVTDHPPVCALLMP